MKRILIVDDERNICEVLKMLLEDDGFSVLTASSGRDAVEQLKRGEVIDLIISDLKMPDIDGMGLLEFLKESGREIPLVLITAYGTIESAVEAMKQGAADFITKPFNKDVLRHIIHRIFQVTTLEEENRHLKETIREGRVVYKSRAMQTIMQTVKKVAGVNTPVLINGKSGSGKELVVEAIHEQGNPPGKSRPFIKIHCPAIPETLMESELFGYRRGAFTGASTDFKGKVRLAEGGTLFLDEIGDLPLKIQPKLLRLLEQKRFEPLGSTTTITINTRIICATNRDLHSMVADGLFREDLYYRINAITLSVPSLEERREDILPLSEFFLEKYCREMGKKIGGFSEGAQKALLAYDWPGNVRELRNVIERAVVLAGGSIIRRADLPALDTGMRRPEETPGHGRLAEMEKKLIGEALKRCGGNVSAAAREVGLSRNKLRYRLRKYNLPRSG